TISDATAIEGPTTARFLNVAMSAASSPLDRPKSIAQGPDGDFFVASSLTNAVLRYDSATYQYLGQFVSPGSGGLTNPIDLLFVNGELLVSSGDTDEVLRYDDETGAYLGKFIPAGANGLDRPTDLVEHNGLLYVSGLASGDVQRYNLATGAFVDKFVTGMV